MLSWGARLPASMSRDRPAPSKSTLYRLIPKIVNKRPISTPFFIGGLLAILSTLGTIDAEGVAKALPLVGRWDETGAHIDDGTITFACTNGALAKCARWGYKPWKTFKGKPLRDYHQACTRMVRADYCGNGVGHTQNGTPIDVYDRLGLQQRTQPSVLGGRVLGDSGMTFEAA